MKNIRVPADTWFVVGEEDGANDLRLFRSNQTAFIVSGESRSDSIPVVEITSPGEIDEILRTADSSGFFGLPEEVYPCIG